MAEPLDNQNKNRREIPLPVQLAQQALNVLATEEGSVSAELNKQLPTFAMQLAKSGEEVTVDILLDYVRAGDMAGLTRQRQQLKTYAEIVAGFPAADIEIGSNLFIATRDADLNTFKRLVNEGAEVDKKVITCAAENGHLNIVKYVIEKQSATVDVAVDMAFQVMNGAMKNDHLDILKYLVTECESYMQINSESAVRCAAEMGHLDIVKYFAERSTDVDLVAKEALDGAARLGRLDIVKYLVEECGMDPHVGQDSALVSAAMKGHLDVVKFLIEEHDADPHAGGCEAPLRYASSYGHLDIVKYLVEEHGANVRGFRHEAEEWAALDGHLDVVKYFTEELGISGNFMLVSAARHGRLNVLQYLVQDRGLDTSYLNERLKKTLNDYIATCKDWQKVAHRDPPHGVIEDPAYFKPKAFKSVSGMLAKEGYEGDTGAAYAFYATGLFGNEDRVLQYLEKWGKAGKQPLHDIVQIIKLPKQKTPEMDLKSWADAVLKCGPSMARLVKFADKLPVPEKTDDGRTWSMVKTREKVAQFAYEKASENPALAALCMEHDVEREDFNTALELSDKAPSLKNIPDIALDGEAFDMPGAKFHRLAADDIRGLFLGEMTDCCQSIGGFGEECAKHGFISENSSFYVVENARGRIVGQTWAWRGTKGELVLDSLETLGSNVKPEQWQKLTDAFKTALAQKADNVMALHIGTGGATPNSLISAFNNAALPAQPIGYNGYRDSHKQVVVWQRQAGLQ